MVHADVMMYRTYFAVRGTPVFITSGFAFVVARELLVALGGSATSVACSESSDSPCAPVGSSV